MRRLSLRKTAQPAVGDTRWSVEIDVPAPDKYAPLVLAIAHEIDSKLSADTIDASELVAADLEDEGWSFGVGMLVDFYSRQEWLDATEAAKQIIVNSGSAGIIIRWGEYLGVVDDALTWLHSFDEADEEWAFGISDYKRKHTKPLPREYYPEIDIEDFEP